MFDLASGTPFSRWGQLLPMFIPTPHLCFSLFRRKYFLNTNLINQMFSAEVRQMRPYLVIR